MGNISVKVKVLAIIISLSVFGLIIFSYLSFTTYKDDKLAFIYDYLSNETQSKSMIFSSTIENHDLMISSIIPKIDFKTKSLPTPTLNFLNSDPRLVGLYYQIPHNDFFENVVLFESEIGTKETWSWASLKEAPLGMSLLDGQKGYVLYKKNLATSNSFVAMIFKQMEIANLLESSPDRFSLLVNDREIISRDALPIEQDSLKKVFEHVTELKSTSGLFEMKLTEGDYFVSFSKLGQSKLLLISMIKSKKVLMVQDVFFYQVLGFLVLMASISLLVGTLAARWLTWHIDNLTLAAREIANENFDINIEVTSSDELGVLAQSFNGMSKKIKNLLSELKKYTVELEVLVEERTRDLQNLTDIQKGMLDSLGQGFVIVDKNHSILPVYSKVASDMFEVIPDRSRPGEILQLKKEDENSFNELHDLVFQNILGFDDMVKLSPDMRTNSKDQKIQLNYAPIRKGEETDTEYILIIGTDKTAEIENMEKFKKEVSFSKMIKKVASNRFSLNKIIMDSMSMLDDCSNIMDRPETKYPIRTVQRLVHTVKGSFSAFYIVEIQAMAHELESFLEKYYDVEYCPEEIRAYVSEKISHLKIGIESYIDRFDEIIQFKESITHKQISFQDLKDFSAFLAKKEAALAQAFESQFFKLPVTPFFQMYPEMVEDLSRKLNKKVRFRVEGGDLLLPQSGPWGELFNQFVHFLRNSMDHGIEPPSKRIEKGKSEVGEIVFKFEKINNKLKITLQDDGGGIDWERIAKKDSSVKSKQDAIERIKFGGVSSKDEVSDISGRGVGVSAIFEVVSKLGGQAEMFSELNQGTSVTIEIQI